VDSCVRDVYGGIVYFRLHVHIKPFLHFERPVTMRMKEVREVPEMKGEADFSGTAAEGLLPDTREEGPCPCGLASFSGHEKCSTIVVFTLALTRFSRVTGSRKAGTTRDP
jgi:hypothetical protein